MGFGNPFWNPSLRRTWNWRVFLLDRPCKQGPLPTRVSRIEVVAVKPEVHWRCDRDLTKGAGTLFSPRRVTVGRAEVKLQHLRESFFLSL